MNQKSRIIYGEKGNYQYTNHILDCELYSETEALMVKPFEHKIETNIQELREKYTSVSHISLYFRELNDGTWIGINEREEFSPASLLKVPLMMAYLKASETDPSLLKKKIKYSQDDIQLLPQNITPAKQIVPDVEYTVEELIKYMIKYSDNRAQKLLVQNIDPVLLNNIYTDLGITIPGLKGIEDYMSVREYASFFRILFNSTYLSRDMSEKALVHLSNVDFNDDIRKGIPKNIPLAHKFGERKIVNSAGESSQLHDCGIVYYQEKPYLLCIMTRGQEMSELKAVISEISSFVYKEVSSSK